MKNFFKKEIINRSAKEQYLEDRAELKAIEYAYSDLDYRPEKMTAKIIVLKKRIELYDLVKADN